MTAPVTTAEAAAGAGPETDALPLPRLILRLGGAGNRKFGRDTGIDVDPAELEAAAKSACAAVLDQVAETLLRIHAEDHDPGNVYPRLGHSRWYWLSNKLGVLFGESDRWERHKRAETKACVFSETPPKLQVLTGDATGGDAIIRKAAVALRKKLAVDTLPIVVAPPSGVADGLGVGTIPDDRKRAKKRLSRAEADRQMRVNQDRAYGFRAQSDALRHHSDILLAIWDPDTEGKPGGTWESVMRALGEGVPVIAIRFTGIAEARIDVLRTPEDLDRPDRSKRKGGQDSPENPEMVDPEDPWKSDLSKVIEELLCFPGRDWRRAAEHRPEESHTHSHHRHKSSYHPRVAFATFREGGLLRSPWVGRLWQPFDKVMKGRIRADDFADELWASLGKSNKATARAPAVPGTYGYHYDYAKNRASDMAAVFGDAHRGGIVASYALAAAAVLLALLGHSLHGLKPLWPAYVAIAALEMVVIFVLAGLAIVSRVENWHEAYTDTRILAEALRAMKYIAPLGVHTPLPKLPGFVEGEQSHSRRTLWSVWYFRALVREAPLRVPSTASIDLKKMRETLLEEWIGPRRDGKKDTSQSAHHELNVEGQKTLERRVDNFTDWTFRVVILAAIGHLLVAAWWPRLENQPEDVKVFFESLRELLFWACVGGPALLAACHGFLSQIEAARLCQRSEGMLPRLAEHYRIIAALKLEENAESARAVWGLSMEAITVASLMMDEVAEWSLIYSREIPLH